MKWMAVRRKFQTAVRMSGELFFPRRRTTLLTYATTYLCNSRCTTCNIWQKYLKDPGHLQRELTIGEVEQKLLKSPMLEDIRSVTFTGGESLLRRDFVELYLLFAERYPRAVFGVASNGMATGLIVRKADEIVNRLRARGDNRSIHLGFSLDGIGPLHDAIRGSAGNFSKVMRTLKEVRQIAGTEVSFSCTLSPWNYRSFTEICHLSAELHVPLGCRMAHSGDYYGNRWQNFDWSEESLRELEGEIRRWQRRQPRSPLLKRITEDGSRYFYEFMVREHRRGRRVHRCFSGSHSFFMDPYGNVSPCIILAGSWGNICERSIEEIWSSPEAGRARKSIRRKECHCWTNCETVPSLGKNWSVFAWNLWCS